MTTAADLIKKTYRPSMTVGQVYARPYGSTAPLTEIGNVLELTLEHKENVIKQADMTVLGGGTHAEVRRVEDVSISMKLADLNITNLARATLGTVQGIDSGTVTDEPHTPVAGGLLRLAHIAPTAVVVKKGADAASATVVASSNTYEARAEGVYVLPGATLAAGEKWWISYSYGEQAVIEALTTKAAELELSFGGLNEADGGRPCVVDVYRVSQSVSKQLALINDKFGQLDVAGTVLKDPTKTGVGISRFYRQTVA
ncbi:hypothetical protein [Ottowia sp. SB7-C50]|uniref:phage tail tube protein n=1 Tax=Ottowia sp. SB7-C50 TaxID=3081231 RepID=UPI0029538356|nr:hypothetical protein [Ottowia sp. SB7-C50]WOP15768.1 hypothetical protein R0D99_01440 [Ottowia sp. SB7-C50]